MFESDDFDQVLSQFDLPEEPQRESKSNQHVIKEIFDSFQVPNAPEESQKLVAIQVNEDVRSNNSKSSPVSSKHVKRKIINSHFDHKTKRKFPGPAGMLSLGRLDESVDNKECQIELLSQDIDYSQAHLQKYLFDSPLWTRLLVDLKDWKLNEVNSIKAIKQQALGGNLRKMKAQLVTAFVEMVDRSAIDPLVTLRDNTGTIKCTLHRDAWSSFSKYIVAEYCAIVLWKPTVLTTGSTFKKHYLNITLGNILAVYSSTVFDVDEEKVPDGYIKVQEEEFTVIKSAIPPEDKKISFNTNTFEALDDLENLFSDDIF